jgi:cell shape-determining protein MreD
MTWKRPLSSRKLGIPARYWFALLVTFLAALSVATQGRVPLSVRFWDMAPEFGLFLAVAVGLLRNPAAGAGAGFVTAYLQTSLSPFSPGSTYFIDTVVGFLAGLVSGRFYTDHPLVAAVSGALAGVVAETLFYILDPRSAVLWLRGAGAQAIYGLVMTPVFYAVLHRTARNIPDVSEPA